MQTLHFRVAEVYFAISAENAAEIKKLLPSYAPFYVKDEAQSLILQAQIVSGAVSVDAEGREIGQFDCGGTNHAVYLLDNGYKFVISTLEGVVAAAMKTDALFTHAVITLYGNDDDKSFGLGNAMMIAYSFSAAHHHILLMHSSVTMNSDLGFLFLGKSGTGKSTHSSLWRQYIPGSDLLNDDNPALRYDTEKDVVYVYGTPWSGKTPCYRNLRLPAAAVVRLEQYPQNEIRRESKLRAFASVLSSCSTMIWDKPSYAAISRTAEAVAQHVPVYYLRCRADREAAELSHSTIFADRDGK